MKFKNTKKKKVYKKEKSKKAKKFPSNYRIIPESIKREEVFFVTGVLSIFCAILIVSADIYLNIKNQKSYTDEKVRILNEINFWENEIVEKPNYRDAYFKLAILNYELRKYDEAKNYLEKVFNLDPSFEEGKELKNFLE